MEKTYNYYEVLRQDVHEELEEIYGNLVDDIVKVIVEAIDEERHEIYSGYYLGEKHEVDREILSTFDEIYIVDDDYVIGLRLR